MYSPPKSVHGDLLIKLLILQVAASFSVWHQESPQSNGAECMLSSFYECLWGRSSLISYLGLHEPGARFLLCSHRRWHVHCNCMSEEHGTEWLRSKLYLSFGPEGLFSVVGMQGEFGGDGRK